MGRVLCFGGVFYFLLVCFVALQILSLKLVAGGTAPSWQQGGRLGGWIPTKCPRSAQTHSLCLQIDIQTILCTMKEAAPKTTMPNLVFIHPILIKASKRFLALLKLRKMWIDAQTLPCWQCTSLTHVPCAAETLIVVCTEVCNLLDSTYWYVSMYLPIQGWENLKNYEIFGYMAVILLIISMHVLHCV